METSPEQKKHLETLHKTGFWGKRGAGCLMLSRQTGRFLVALRSAFCQQPCTYGTIGGAIDSGETPVEAMQRELIEECGYAGNIAEIKALHLFSQVTLDGTTFNYHNFLIVIDDEFEAHQHWETEKFVWVSFEELLMLPTKHFGLEALLIHSSDVLSAFSNEFANPKS